MRFLDIWSSLPGMLLCILISAVLGAGFFNTVLALAIGNVPIDVRLIAGRFSPNVPRITWRRPNPSTAPI